MSSQDRKDNLHVSPTQLAVSREMVTDFATEKSFALRALGWTQLLQTQLPNSQKRLGDKVMYAGGNNDYLYPDVVRGYSSQNGTIVEVGLCVTDTLIARYNFGTEPIKKRDAEALLVYRVDRNYCALELTPDEFRVVHTIIANIFGVPEIAIHDIPQLETIRVENPEKVRAIERGIQQVYLGFLDKLGELSFPIFNTNSTYNFPLAGNDIRKLAELCEEGVLHLPLVAGNVQDYFNAMQTVVDNAGVKGLIEQQPENVGDVARRLRQLGMYSEEGSVRGVYTDGRASRQLPTVVVTDWEEIPDDPRSREYIKSHLDLGSGMFTLGDAALTVHVCIRDSEVDSRGHSIFFHLQRDENFLTLHMKLNEQNKIEPNFCEFYESDLDAHEAVVLSTQLSAGLLNEWFDSMLYDNIQPEERWFGALFDYALESEHFSPEAPGSKVIVRCLMEIASAGSHSGKEWFRSFLRELLR